MGVTGATSVLVVDDDADTRELLGQALRDEGYDTVACADLSSARRAIAQHPHVDVALVEFYLPDGLGIDLCRDLRAQGVPCLIVSSYPTWLVGTAHPAPDWISKPFAIDDLLERVRGQLPKENVRT